MLSSEKDENEKFTLNLMPATRFKIVVGIYHLAASPPFLTKLYWHFGTEEISCFQLLNSLESPLL